MKIHFQSVFDYKTCYVQCSVTASPWVRASTMQVLCPARPTIVVMKRHHQSDVTTDTTTQPTTDGEKRLADKLQKTFPKASEIRVIDISGLY